MAEPAAVAVRDVKLCLLGVRASQMLWGRSANEVAVLTSSTSACVRVDLADGGRRQIVAREPVRPWRVQRELHDHQRVR